MTEHMHALFFQSDLAHVTHMGQKIRFNCYYTAIHANSSSVN